MTGLIVYCFKVEQWGIINISHAFVEENCFQIFFQQQWVLKVHSHGAATATAFLSQWGQSAHTVRQITIKNNLFAIAAATRIGSEPIYLHCHSLCLTSVNESMCIMKSKLLIVLSKTLTNEFFQITQACKCYQCWHQSFL